jgi:hypothetical protein
MLVLPAIREAGPTLIPSHCNKNARPALVGRSVETTHVERQAIPAGTNRPRAALRGCDDTDADRKRFEEIAADYQNELDATETTESQPPAAGEATSSSQEAAVRTNQSQPEADDQNAAAPVASSKEDQGPTTD